MIIKTKESSFNMRNVSEVTELSQEKLNFVPWWVWLITVIFFIPGLLVLLFVRKTFYKIEVEFKNGEKQEYYVDTDNLNKIYSFTPTQDKLKFS